jgi:hypothetical protein
MSDLADEISASPAPVLLPDTCAVLDVIRTGLFRRTDKRNLTAARGIAAAAVEEARRLWIITPQQVIEEWGRNHENVTAEVEKALRNKHEHLGVLRELSEIVPGATFAAPDLRGLSLASRLEDAAVALVDAARVLDADLHATMRAVERTNQGRKPAARGKDSIGDCMIFEHILAFGHELRGRGFAPPIIFVSSNTRDYGSPSDSGNELLPQLAGAGIQFVNDLAYAAAVLGPTVVLV